VSRPGHSLGVCLDRDAEGCTPRHRAPASGARWQARAGAPLTQRAGRRTRAARKAATQAAPSLPPGGVPRGLLRAGGQRAHLCRLRHGTQPRRLNESIAAAPLHPVVELACLPAAASCKHPRCTQPAAPQQHGVAAPGDEAVAGGDGPRRRRRQRRCRRAGRRRARRAATRRQEAQKGHARGGHRRRQGAHCGRHRRARRRQGQAAERPG
jgi:hypothetical protein